MKSKKLISKISILALAGITVMAPSAALQAKVTTAKKVTVIKKPIKKPVNNGVTTGGTCQTKPSGSTTNKPSSGTNTGGSTSSGSTTNKPSSGTNTGGSTSSGSQTGTSTQKSFEDQVLVLVNQERAKQGLSPLQMDESVRKVARTKSSDMSKNKYFSHTSPTYGTPFAMLKQFGISYSAAAENIAQGYTTPEAVVKGWMNSAGHKANILNSKYTHIGIGYEANGNYWTQLFIAK